MSTRRPGAITHGHVPAAVTALVMVLAALVPLQATGAHAAPEVLNRPADGVYELDGRGYGHGRGLSQHGARGAATQGLNHQQILDFYYPGTTTGTYTGPDLRVMITADERFDVAVVPSGVMAVDDPDTSAPPIALPDTVGGAAVQGWRVVRSVGLLWFEGQWAGAWRPFPEGGQLRATSSIRMASSTGVTRLQLPNGSVVGYRGNIDGVNDPAGVLTVNRLGMEPYLRGVVAAEMPSSWPANALRAQSVAARSYAAALMRPTASYDLCDTTACQVYKGVPGESSATDAAITATAGQVRVASGRPILAEFSAANGGWTVAADKPWFVAKADPYDGVVPSTAHTWTDDVTVAEIESRYPAIGSLRSITVTSRDGKGAWGGRILGLTLTGSAGNLNVTGAAFRTAFGLKSTWWATSPEPTIPTAVRNPTAVAGDQYVSVSWDAPVSDGGSPVTGYLIYHSYAEPPTVVGASARTALVSGLENGGPYRLDVYAVNAAGRSPTATTNQVTPAGTAAVLRTTDPQRIWSSASNGGPLQAGQVRRVQVTGLGGVPSGAAAAVLNLTVTGTSGASFLTTWSEPHPRPEASVLNWDGAGQTVAGMVQAKLSADGTVNVVNNAGSATVLVDVLGYYVRGTGSADDLRFVSSPPSRAFDTLTGLGTAPTPFGPRERRDLGLAAVQGVPGTPAVPHGARAALLNVTGDGSTAATHVTVWGADRPLPATSNLNPAPGVTRANTVLTRVDADREIAAYHDSGRSRLIGDVLGAFVPGGSGDLFRPLLADRLLDTRSAVGGHPGALGQDQELLLDVTGVGGVPTTGVSAVALTVTVVAPTAQTYVTAWPSGSVRPSSSNVNAMAGAVVPNHVVVPVGPDGQIRLYNNRGSAHLVVDVAGWYGR